LTSPAQKPLNNCSFARQNVACFQLLIVWPTRLQVIGLTHTLQTCGSDGYRRCYTCLSIIHDDKMLGLTVAEARRLIDRCLSVDAQHRPSLRDLARDDWIHMRSSSSSSSSQCLLRQSHSFSSGCHGDVISQPLDAVSAISPTCGLCITEQPD